jgi:hypothetical protein
MPLKDLLRRRPALPRTLDPKLEAERASHVPWIQREDGNPLASYGDPRYVEGHWAIAFARA